MPMPMPKKRIGFSPIFAMLTALHRYCVNSEDQIRAIDNPDQEFHYFFSKNERYVEKQREAMNSRLFHPILLTNSIC